MRFIRFIVTGFLGCLAAGVLAAAAPPDLERALNAQEEVVLERPGDARAFNDLGNLRLLAGDREGALTAYERAVELDPTLVSAHFNLGLLRQERGELGDAVEQYREVLDLVPDHAWAHFQLGMIAERRDQDRRALRHFVTAFRLDPRLTFDDVNPQIIDSDLVTEALLLLDEEDVSARQAPRSYEEGSRIASLLLPAAPETATTESERLAEEKETEATSAMGSDDDEIERLGLEERSPTEIEPRRERPTDPTSDAAADATPEGAERSRRLTREDLPENSSVGEATPLSGRTRTRRATPSRDLQERLRERYRQSRSGSSPAGTASTGRTGTRVEPDRR